MPEMTPIWTLTAAQKQQMLDPTFSGIGLRFPVWQDGTPTMKLLNPFSAEDELKEGYKALSSLPFILEFSLLTEYIAVMLMHYWIKYLLLATGRNNCVVIYCDLTGTACWLIFLPEFSFCPSRRMMKIGLAYHPVAW